MNSTIEATCLPSRLRSVMAFFRSDLRSDLDLEDRDLDLDLEDHVV